MGIFFCLYRRFYSPVFLAGRYGHIIKSKSICCKWKFGTGFPKDFLRALTHAQDLFLSPSAFSRAYNSDMVSGADIIHLGPWIQKRDVRGKRVKQKDRRRQGCWWRRSHSIGPVLCTSKPLLHVKETMLKFIMPSLFWIFALYTIELNPNW